MAAHIVGALNVIISAKAGLAIGGNGDGDAGGGGGLVI